VSKSIDEFFSSHEIQILIQSVIEIPQSIIQGIQESLETFSESAVGTGIAGKIKSSFGGGAA
jgi:hypothetical protein